MGDRTDVGGGDVATFVPPAPLAAIRSTPGPREPVVSAFAAACRLNALGMIQLAGSGHIGSSFSSLDLVSWILIEHLSDDDVYFSSKGHDAPGLYAALIGLDRLPFELVTRLRRLGGLPGHPDIGTPGIPFNTGSLGMGISKAKGLLLADRIAGRPARRVVVLTGDGELQEGQVWESLATAARDRLEGLTVVVDRNHLQSDLPVQEVSDLGDLAARFVAFGWSVSSVDGHDLGAIASALGDGVPGPRAIVADTIKSRGVSFLEPAARPADERFYPFHSGALSAELYGRARDELLDGLEAACAALGIEEVPTVDLRRDAPAVWPTAVADGESDVQRLVPAYGRALLAAAERRADLVVLDADLMVDLALDGFRDAHPDRFVEAGIAEQDMVSMASGLAAGGMLPVVHSFASFLSSRPMEQAVNAASERRRVAYVAALAGLLPAGPGHSHQGLQDIAAFDRIGATVIAPSSEASVADAVEHLLAAPGTTYLRLCSVATTLPFAPSGLPPVGRGRTVHAASGDRDTVVLAYGPVLLGEAVRAVRSDDDLAARIEVLDLPWVNSVDGDWLREMTAGCDRIVVLDDHEARNGLGTHVAALVGRDGSGPRVIVLGVEGLPECGAPAEVLAHHGLDATAIADRLRAD